MFVDMISLLFTVDIHWYIFLLKILRFKTGISFIVYHHIIKVTL